MNNNLLTERALRDVFATTSYITFGSSEDPFPYPVKMGAHPTYSQNLSNSCPFDFFVKFNLW